MARKNLKSTTAKSSNQLFGQKNLTGIGQPFNPYPSKNVAPLNMFQQQSSQLPDS